VSVKSCSNSSWKQHPLERLVVVPAQPHGLATPPARQVPVVLRHRLITAGRVVKVSRCVWWPDPFASRRVMVLIAAHRIVASGTTGSPAEVPLPRRQRRAFTAI
jgi:hypothetical protein